MTTKPTIIFIAARPQQSPGYAAQQAQRVIRVDRKRPPSPIKVDEDDEDIIDIGTPLLPTRLKNSDGEHSDSGESQLDMLYRNDDKPPRKRERLTHLTPEEKMQRRKLKNRVAAQAARDRKKEYTESIESRLQRLEANNQALAEENAALKRRNAQLEAMVTAQQPRAFESAALISGPQPRDQARDLHTLLTILLTLINSTPMRKNSKPSSMNYSAMRLSSIESKLAIRRMLGRLSPRQRGQLKKMLTSMASVNKGCKMKTSLHN